MYSRAAALALCKVRTVKLPKRTRAVTSWDNGRGFVIALNANLTAAERRFVLEHELAHIRLGHFWNTTDDRETMEREADRLARRELGMEPGADLGDLTDEEKDCAVLQAARAAGLLV